MSFRLSLSAAALLATFGTAAAEAQDAVTADTVLATVNGVEITAGHLILLRAQLGEQYQNYPDNVLFDGLLEQTVQQQLLAGAVEELSPLAQLALDNETRGLLAADAMRASIDGAITEESLQTAYDAAYGAAEPGREYDAAHILLETEDEALAVIAELEGGADFAAMARERSTGPSGPSGGALGWFGQGAMVPPFEAAVVELEPGEISAPVETQFGWHVIRLNDTRVAEVPTLDEVRRELEAQVREQAISDRIAELEEAAEIDKVTIEEIDPAFLSNPSLLQQ